MYRKVEMPIMNQVTDVANLSFQTFMTKVNVDNTGYSIIVR